MRQIHHSTAPEHIDRNFGYVFSVWDHLFGTRFVPEHELQLEHGLGDPGEDQEYSTLSGLYLTPVQNVARLAWRTIKRRPGGRVGAA